MTLNEVELAIGQHLEAMTDCPPIAWPNKDYNPVDGADYIEFRHAPNSVLDDTISGGFDYQQGLVLLTVVSERNAFSGTANGLAQIVKERFPKALRLVSDSGTVLINEPTSFGTPFPDGAYWRQPVRISYITENDISAAQMIASANVSSPNDGLELVGGELRVDIDSLPQA